MKIGFDAKRYFHNTTGLGNYSRDLIRILLANHPEHEYVLYTPKVSAKYKESAPSQSYRQPKNFLDKMFPNLWRAKGIVKDLRDDGIDIYHGLSGELPLGIRKISIKTVVTIHDLIFIRYPELYKYLDRTIYTRKFAYACNQSDRVVAISKQTKQDIVTYFKVPEEKIDVIYQGCHIEFKIKKSEQDQISLLKRLGLPRTFLLNVGTIEPRKNILSVIKAIQNLDIPLVIVGRQTAYLQEITDFIRKHRMENRIFFISGLSMRDLSILYSAAIAFVYPSIFEGFGIPIIEALYSETPVITNAAGVFPEAGGPYSYYVDIDDLEQLKYGIVSVISSTSMQQEMKIKGLDYAQRFNDNILADQWNDFYQKF